MSNWKPSEGLYKAETLVKILEVEAEAAGSVISPVFRHRMVEMIAKTLDHEDQKSSIFDHAKSATLKALSNGHHPEEHTDDEAIHAKPIMGRVHEADATEEVQRSARANWEKSAKPAKTGKAGKKPGKRGRPSKAELEARKAAQA